LLLLLLAIELAAFSVDTALKRLAGDASISLLFAFEFDERKVRSLNLQNMSENAWAKLEIHLTPTYV
jgi:hypothetical protein